MYTKIISPTRHGKIAYDNTGSTAQVANYLDKEERDYEKALKKEGYSLEEETAIKPSQSPENAAHPQDYAQEGTAIRREYRGFFNDHGKDISKTEAISYLDKANQARPIDAGKPRFFSLTFNFSEEESKFIEAQPDSRAYIKSLVSDYMDSYAKTFKYKDKSFAKEDLSYFAKIHDFRRRNNKLETIGQLHVHVEVSRLDKKAAQQLNPETRYSSKFNKNHFFEKVTDITARRTGIAPEIKVQRYQVTQLKNQFLSKDAITLQEPIKKNAQLFNRVGAPINAEQAEALLINNRKGLKKEQALFSTITIKPQKRFSAFLGDAEHFNSTAHQIANNYARSLKREGLTASDLLYIAERKTDAKGKNFLELHISNRDINQTFSTSAHKSNLDLERFDRHNNATFEKVKKEKSYVSPFTSKIYILNKKYNLELDAQAISAGEFIKADHRLNHNSSVILSRMNRGEALTSQQAETLIRSEHRLEKPPSDAKGKEAPQNSKVSGQAEVLSTSSHFLQRISGISSAMSHSHDDNETDYSRQQSR